MSLRPIPDNARADLARGGSGLAVGDAATRLAAQGPNDILVAPAASWKETLGDTLRDPMIWFLAGVSVLFAVIGDYAEATVLALALVPLMGMDAWLHRRTQASTQGLASRLATQAVVIRSGAAHLVSAQDVVVGDVVEVQAGEPFPADGILVEGAGVQVDESAMTGESWPVRKVVFSGSPVPPALDMTHWCLAGTRLLTGPARVRIVATGRETLYADIVRSALLGPHALTPLQQSAGRLVAVMLRGAIALCLLLAAVRLVQGHGLLDAFLSAVTLAVAAIPEEFPVVMAMFLGVGVYRLARRKALVRRAVAVENIGRLTCICSDKTGTLTEGRLALAHVVPASGHPQVDVLAVARLAARAESGDPLDLALLEGAPVASLRRLAAFPFTEDRRRETCIVDAGDGLLVAAVKGAPETVFGLCDGGLDPGPWRAQLESLAEGGHKVIAVARRDLNAGEDVTREPTGGYTLLGLIAFEDPVREGVREAVARCQAGGIRVIMVTGDHPLTARAVARDIGLGGGDPHVLLADAIDGPVSAAALAQADVVARATPSQKLKLVQALRAAGESVAVTGDGVNDVPAIKAADVGIAMGERGTQSAREVASIVLLDDNFRTIADAVAEGRQLFVNLQLAFIYLLLVHIPLVLSAALVPLLDNPILYLPVHVVILELVIHPTALLAFQQAATGGLRPIPREGPSHFFPFHTWLRVAGSGLVLSAMLVAAFEILSAQGAGEAEARSVVLAMLVVWSAAMALALNRSTRGISAVIPIVSAALVVLLVQMPVLSGYVHLAALGALDWAAIAVSSLLAAGLAVFTRASLHARTLHA
ncbi:MAG: cation-transporting P-type ATPase [Alphaproteobacteria bacterium]|nr:cation-transporting P-type ATPase [Alphaproteobacteria bacterium]